MKVGTRIKHTRRTGEVCTGKVLANHEGLRGHWVDVEVKSAAGKLLALRVRPSQLVKV